MRSPEGRDYSSTGVYREIVLLERIVCTNLLADAEGNVVPPSPYPIPAGWSSEPELTVTFEEHQGKTKMTLRHTGIPAGPSREMAGAGWNGSFDKMADYLAPAAKEKSSGREK
jgi:uncharacterized protein YndB with AHSA1/START domain